MKIYFRRRPTLLLLLLLAAGVSSFSSRPAGAADAVPPRPAAQILETQGSAPPLRIAVDPRVELLSLLFRLAGNPEYNQARVATYADDAENQFGNFRDHPAVKLAARLRGTRGVSYDAVMGLAVHLQDASDLQFKVPLAPWPESLDRRWSADSASEFASAARQFVRDTGFAQFLQKHHAFYETTTKRLTELMAKQGHLEWFKAYFGERPGAAFTLVPGLLNGGCCYGPHFAAAHGPEELFCILGVWKTDADGLPQFTADMLDTVVHEFGHSYANPLIDRHLNEMRQPAETLFADVAERMRSQAYGEASTMLRESLVRACVVRYVRQYRGADAAAREIQNQKNRGFLWMPELSALLGEYESHREKYPTLEAFAPRLVAFFKEYAARRKS